MFKYSVYVVIFISLFCSQNSFSQESKTVQRRQAQLEKQEEKKKKMGEKAHQESLEKHQKIQTKETQKRMKKNKKKSKKINNNRGDSFFERLFSFHMSEENIFFADRLVSCKLPS